MTASLAGLAFLGAGEKYRANHERALAYVMAHVLDGGRGPGETGANWNQTNWSLGYGGIYLAEVCARDSRSPAREVLAKVVKRLEENQEQTGGYAHGPGGPNALGYLELEIVSNFAIAALGMAKRAGIEADEARTVKAIEYVKSCTSGGGVAYSTRPGQAGAGEAGRTAGAYWAFRQAGRDGRFEDGMAKYFERGLGRLTEGHVSPAMHILAGGLASSFRGKKSMSKFWKIYLPYVMSCRVAGGAFDARPTEESRSLQSNSDRSNGPAFITAHYALLLQLGQDRFKLLDR
ncbi:MAG: DUF6288 domain-containing protein [Planctomycetota bacterium]